MARRRRLGVQLKRCKNASAANLEREKPAANICGHKILDVLCEEAVKGRMTLSVCPALSPL